MGLFGGVVPKTVENFRALCTGEKGKSNITGKFLDYRGSRIHKVVPGMYVQGGDFINRDGTGGESIYGKDFKHENYDIPHDRKHLLTMVNSAPGRTRSQFMITFQKMPWLDKKNVVFGKVINGGEICQVLDRMHYERSNCDQRLNKEIIKIVDSGELDVNKEYKTPFEHRFGEPEYEPKPGEDLLRFDSLEEEAATNQEDMEDARRFAARRDKDLAKQAKEEADFQELANEYIKENDQYLADMEKEIKGYSKDGKTFEDKIQDIVRQQ